MNTRSRKLWIGFYAASLTFLFISLMPFILGMVLLGNKFSGYSAALMLLFAILGASQFIIVQFLYTLLILSKMREIIQNSHIKITSDKAIGLLFISLFNV